MCTTTAGRFSTYDNGLGTGTTSERDSAADQVGTALEWFPDYGGGQILLA